MAEERQPTRWQSLLFSAKCMLLRLRRWVRDPHGRPGPLPHSGTGGEGSVLAESRSLLYPLPAGTEFGLQAGKVQNLRAAARYLDGRVLEAGALFSFWAHVPRPTSSRGFALGRELRAGCVIPSVGGGLCQLSNALYDAALQAGCVIVERHAHSRSMPGRTAAAGRDATIFWNYVDLRFRAPVPCRLEVTLSRSELHVRLRALQTTPRAPLSVLSDSGQPDAEPAAESCETCGVHSCFRHPEAMALPRQSRTAWLLDAWWPEHDAYLQEHRQPGDALRIPFASRRWKIGPYYWGTDGPADVHTVPWFVFRRSLESRRLRAEGAARQRALLRMDRELAQRYAQQLPSDALHVVVSQNLLPFLWQEGHLAGRTFDVLMTRLPMAELQRQLDRAAARWPGTSTLEDFRADAALVAAESEALAEAVRWITPHTDIARLAGSRAICLPWHKPPSTPRSIGSRLIFPAGALSRKGARELREAAAGLGIPLILASAVRENAAFWQEIQTEPAGPDWLADAGAVVLPAWVEHQPRRILAALAAGIPVIVTSACGLPPQEGLTLVPEGDSRALRAAIQDVLAKAQCYDQP